MEILQFGFLTINQTSNLLDISICNLTAKNGTLSFLTNSNFVRFSKPEFCLGVVGEFSAVYLNGNPVKCFSVDQKTCVPTTFFLLPFFCSPNQILFSLSCAPPSEQTAANAGMIVGIVSTVILLIVIIVIFYKVKWIRRKIAPYADRKKILVSDDYVALRE